MFDEIAGEVARAPYPGLRSFRRDETDLFFGREDCIHTLVDRLAETRFLAVLGSSGTGKSSIVKTGLLEALEIGLMEQAGARWRVIDFRPGSTPLTNLARELLKVTAKGKEPTDIETKILRGFLARGPRSIIEWCQDGNLPTKPKTNLLLLVDQFEELFRYQDYAGKEESEAFSALLLESAHSPEFPIYVTLTMRSEYLGACALMEGLAETISKGMVLTPRMTREQCRRAIVGPAEVCGIKVEEPLVTQILNDLANFAPWDDGGAADQLDRLVRRADQLPLLQYTLNRLWLDAKDTGSGGYIQLRLSDYKAIGGLGGALNTHGNILLGELTKKGLAGTAEKIFRALVSGTSVADAVRRPQRFGELIALCDGNVRAVEDVLYTFCAPGCNFLAPELRDPGPEKRVPIDADQWIDISHESLIRQWKKMAEWLHDETTAAQNWRRLKDRMGDAEPIRGRELANLVAWYEETKPNEAWAQRYGGHFKDAVAFLEKSEKAETARRRLFWISGAGIFAILIASSVTAGTEWWVAQHANEKLKTTIGELKQQKDKLDKTIDQLNKSQAALDNMNAVLASTQVKLQEQVKQLKEIQARYEGEQSAKELNAKIVAEFGPPPVGTFQDEDKDDQIAPTDALSNKLNGPTPRTIPGGNAITTQDLYHMLANGKLPGTDRKVSILLIDVDSEPHARTIPSSLRWPYAGAGGTFDAKDKVQRQLFDDLSKAVTSSNTAIIFFSRDSKSWEGYNAALRALQMGYSNVYWYRGGLAAWQAADLITKP
ncbi:MAG: rhodanese-like domain-containing protein [Methylovirgula sp.]